MTNALKLEESVEETAKEVPEEYYRNILIPISSGTIAKGVIQGVLAKLDHRPTRFILHLGYSRSHDQVRRYVSEGWKIKDKNLVLVDEGYNYKDVSKDRTIPPWPCNRHYDLKAFHWWLREGQDRFGQALLWNIG